MKLYVSTWPYGSPVETPLKMLEENNFQVRCNPYKRKMTSAELAKEIKDSEILIAGTERIDQKVLDCAPNLKHIARVGIGLDGLCFSSLKKRNISLTYTPDAPTQSVAEQTVAMMIFALRDFHKCQKNMIQDKWIRPIGQQLSGSKVGIIGFGRIGKTVAHLLSPFRCKILINDLIEEKVHIRNLGATFASKDEIYSDCNIISLHLPYNKQNHHLISKNELGKMKKNTILINTARGGLIHEEYLLEYLNSRHIKNAAIDVFENEPYTGPLSKNEHCITTAHMGSCSQESRIEMEIGAAKEAIHFLKGEPFDEEFQL